MTAIALRRTTPRWQRAFQFWLTWYRRTWTGTIVNSLVSPIVFLAGMGLGVGTLVDDGARGDQVGGDYLAFLTPGLLVATAFMGGAMLASYPVLGAVKWSKCYHAMAATPLRPFDIALGHLAYMALYLTVVSTGFFAVAALIGGIDSWVDLIAIPAGVLTGVATAAPIMGWAATRVFESGFASLWRYVVTPLSLFGGTYFPFDQLPLGVQIVGWLTPLWHGTELARTDLGSGGDLVAAAGHLAYLSAVVVASCVVTTRCYRRVLTP